MPPLAPLVVVLGPRVIEKRVPILPRGSWSVGHHHAVHRHSSRGNPSKLLPSRIALEGKYKMKRERIETWHERRQKTGSAAAPAPMASSSLLRSSALLEACGRVAEGRVSGLGTVDRSNSCQMTEKCYQCPARYSRQTAS